jgi:hypothetical protein
VTTYHVFWRERTDASEEGWVVSDEAWRQAGALDADTADEAIEAAVAGERLTRSVVSGEEWIAVPHRFITHRILHVEVVEQVKLRDLSRSQEA